MSNNFLLDENIIVRAFVNDRALRIWRGIATNSHRIIVSHVLELQYRAKLRQLNKQTRTEEQARFIANTFINFVLHDSEKSVYLSPRVLPDAERVIHHRNDWFLEDLAVEFGTNADYREFGDTCHFVSTDRNTRAGFNHEKMRALSFTGHTIEAALPLAEAE